MPYTQFGTYPTTPDCLSYYQLMQQYSAANPSFYGMQSTSGTTTPTSVMTESSVQTNNGKAGFIVGALLTVGAACLCRKAYT